jgi:outer membrane protein
MPGLLALALAGQGLLAQEPPQSWKGAAGIAAISQPKFPGSGGMKTRALPVVSLEYGRYFLGGVPGAGIPAGLGAFLFRDAHWGIGVGIGADLTRPRSESDSARLRGLGDVDSTPIGALFAGYQDSRFAARTGVVSDVGGKGEGTRVTLDLEARFRPMDKLLLSAGPGLTWADASYQRTFFGIDAQQSANSGRAPYTANRGINSLRFTVGADYLLSAKYALGVRLGTNLLQGDAASSPITEKKNQNVIAVFGTCRF